MKEWNQKRMYNFFLALLYILMQEKSYIYVHPYYVEEERLLIFSLLMYNRRAWLL